MSFVPVAIKTHILSSQFSFAATKNSQQCHPLDKQQIFPLFDCVKGNIAQSNWSYMTVADHVIYSTTLLYKTNTAI